MSPSTFLLEAFTIRNMTYTLHPLLCHFELRQGPVRLATLVAEVTKSMDTNSPHSFQATWIRAHVTQQASPSFTVQSTTTSCHSQSTRGEALPKRVGTAKFKVTS